MKEKIAIFYNSKRKTSIEFYLKLKKYLRRLGFGIENICVNKSYCREIEASLAISIGGDGTVLYAARYIAGKDIPLLAINAGGLGFLSPVEMKRFKPFLKEVIEKKYKVIERFFLEIESKNRKYIALNDCVIRSTEPRAFSLDVYYNDIFLSKYFGDGIIVSTPTGSTAYNLASSGPIITPHANVFSISPICPHTLTLRPIVLPDSGRLEINLSCSKDKINIIMSIDGQENIKLFPEDKVYITRYEKTLKTIVPKNFSYFELLRKKLSWGER